MTKSLKKITTNPSLIHEVLTKYRNTFFALKELINNSIQAEGKNIYINIEYGNPNSLEDYIKEISVEDDGHGVPLCDFQGKILQIGTTVKTGGRGIGRFGALQIGKKMEIETIGYDNSKNTFTKVIFPFDIQLIKSESFEEVNLELEEEILEGSHNTKYKVTIHDIYGNAQESVPKRNKISIEFQKEKFKNSIFEHYPIAIFNDKISFYINNERLNKENFLLDEPSQIDRKYKNTKGKDIDCKFYFYHVNLTDNSVKVFLYSNNAGIKTVTNEFTYSSDYHTPDLGTWFIYFESEILTTDFLNDLDISDLGHSEWKNLKEFIKENINEFFKEKNQKFSTFVKKLNEDKSTIKINEVSSSKMQMSIFNKIAYLIEDDYKILEKDDKSRFIIYPLINEAIKDRKIRVIFEEIANLKPETKEKLYNLLEKTDLENIIHFASSVAGKLEFLDFLHEITYGDISKVLKERSQLHKIIETNLWLFGENYNDTPCLWSDKKIGNILGELHQKHMLYLPSIEDDNIIHGAGLNDITDLFFLSEKLNDNDEREIMIVELKAPNCSIGMKELNQIDRYGFTIEQNSSLPTEKTRYKLILISSKANDFAQSKLKASRTKYKSPYIYEVKEGKNIEIQVMTWSEIIETNKRKLKYMSNLLEIKEKDVSIKFEEEYNHLIDPKLKSQLRRT